MRCRKLTQCEINNVFSLSETALVTVTSCCNTLSSEMCCYNVKINGVYRLTVVGNVCPQMLNAVSAGESVTVKFTGKNCCGKYCVTASGVPDSATACGCNKVKITLTDYISDGVLKY